MLLTCRLRSGTALLWLALSLAAARPTAAQTAAAALPLPNALRLQAMRQRPVQLLGMTFRPAAASAGQAVQLHIRLTRPAPASGMRIMLSSSDLKALRLPISLLVPAGASGIGLTVTVGKIASAGMVQVRALPASQMLYADSSSFTRTAALKLLALPKGGRQ